MRELRPSDAPAWFTYLSDPVAIAQTSYDMRALDAVQRMINNYLVAHQEQHACRWALARKTDDVLIGTCGFYKWDKTNAVLELGYDLTPAYWNKGYMTHAVQQAVRWAFEDADANRVQATVMVGHTASARVLEKHGFQREGTLHEYLMCRGTPRDFWMYALLQRTYVRT
jgi:RimJ/RimL family protein N-acetyltransferase